MFLNNLKKKINTILAYLLVNTWYLVISELKNKKVVMKYYATFMTYHYKIVISCVLRRILHTRCLIV